MSRHHLQEEVTLYSASPAQGKGQKPAPSLDSTESRVPSNSSVPAKWPPGEWPEASTAVPSEFKLGGEQPPSLRMLTGR